MTGESEPVTGESGAMTGESEAVTGESEAVTGESGAMTGESEAVTGESGAMTGESEAVTGESRAVIGETGTATGNTAPVIGESVRTGRAPGLFEPDGDEFGHANFFHRNAVKRARGFHCAFVVRDDDELSVGRHGHNLVGEASDICFIKRRVDFVEQAEGRGPILKYSQHQSERGHCFFTARKQQHILQALARRLGHDVYA